MRFIKWLLIIGVFVIEVTRPSSCKEVKPEPKPTLYAGVTKQFVNMIPEPVTVDTLDVTETALPERSKEALSADEEPTEDEILPDYFEYLCQCVEAEAGDQDYLGKCYVVDCILNRVDSDEFPDNVIDVINQKDYWNGEWHWQFEVVKNNHINEVKVTESTRQAVMEELTGERKNYEMLFFCMWEFDWCEFMFKHGDHYFHK